VDKTEDIRWREFKSYLVESGLPESQATGEGACRKSEGLRRETLSSAVSRGVAASQWVPVKQC